MPILDLLAHRLTAFLRDRVLPETRYGAGLIDRAPDQGIV